MSADSPTPGREAQVLVVDDEENIRRLLRLILTRMSNHRCAVQEASTAEEGMERLKATRFDLIISDYRMPGKNGVDLLEAALHAQPEAARVLITAFGEMDIGIEAINRGHVDGFLRKPWDNARLIALVDSLIAARLAGTVPPRAGLSPAAGVARVEDTKERQDLEQKLAEINREMQRLRVRLGLGSLSAEGYQRAVDELARQRADIETKLLRK